MTKEEFYTLFFAFFSKHFYNILLIWSTVNYVPVSQL